MSCRAAVAAALPPAAVEERHRRAPKPPRERKVPPGLTAPTRKGEPRSMRRTRQHIGRSERFGADTRDPRWTRAGPKAGHGHRGASRRDGQGNGGEWK